jgi:sugar (pentulose or hexulose) kinase
MIGVVKRAHAAYRPHPIRAADLYNGNLSASILRIKSKPQPRARSLIADEATVSANAIDNERNGRQRTRTIGIGAFARNEKVRGVAHDVVGRRVRKPAGVCGRARGMVKCTAGCRTSDQRN